MTIFLTALRRIASQPLNWVFVLLFPALLAALLASGAAESTGGPASTGMTFGVADLDDTVLSKTLVNQLKVRYNVIALNEAGIPASLTDSDIPWALLIRAGYERDILAGREPSLEGWSLTISDVSALGSVYAENITRALMLLGSDEPEILAAWEEAARVDVTALDAGGSWGEIAYWIGFYGFISLFTAYFVIKTLSDDKRGGMPDRIGVLPVTPRRTLLAGTLAAFTVTEFTALLLLCVLRLFSGAIPNALPLFALLSLYNLFTVGFVLAIVSAARNQGAASVALAMGSTLFSMLGGLFWPIEFMPEFMRRLGWFSPGYWLAQGLGNIRELTFAGYGVPMLFLAGFTLVAMILGGWKRVQPMEG